MFVLRQIFAGLQGGELCYGEPVRHDDRVVIPVARVSTAGGGGFGAGAGRRGQRRRGRRLDRRRAGRLHRHGPGGRALRVDPRPASGPARGVRNVIGGVATLVTRRRPGARGRSGSDGRPGAAVASAIAAPVISTRRRSSSSAIASGGMRTTTSPSGRMIAPRRRAASVTWWPIRASSGKPAELDADHEAAAADLGDRRQRRDVLVEQLGEQRDLRLQARERALLLEDVERRERRGAGERVARVRVAVEERAELLEARRGSPRRRARSSSVAASGR